MPKDAPPNGSAPGQQTPVGSWSRVSEMQAKLHRWAAADPGRRFEDLFNLVYDRATLMTAWDRVAGNQGANTPGIDGVKAADLTGMKLSGFLDDLRSSVKDGSFRPQPVRERKIPKPGGSGKVRALGIPTVADRVVQAALKLVLEPIFEADFKPVSYGFQPRRRAQDAIAEIRHMGTHGYRWVLDADMVAERTRFPVTRTGAVAVSSSAVTVTVPFVPSASGPFTSTGISAEPPAGIVTCAGADAVKPADAAAFTGTVTERRSRFVTRNRASAAVPGVTGMFTPNGGSTASCVRSGRTAAGVRTANVHDPDPTSYTACPFWTPSERAPAGAWASDAPSSGTSTRAGAPGGTVTSSRRSCPDRRQALDTVPRGVA